MPTTMKLTEIEALAKERFWKKVSREKCWNWTASKNSCGYGNFFYRGRLVKSHRFSFEIWIGRELKKSELILHKCDNPACVNPEHLFIGDMKTNTHDMIAKGRANYQKKTHCVNGHELTPNNVRLHNYRGGVRKVCKECGRIHSRNNWRMKRWGTIEVIRN